jgi:hypothetical protein
VEEVIMNNKRGKWIEAVAKIMQLTQDGDIKWQADNPSDSLKRTPDEKINVVFNAKYKENNLQLYERRYREPFITRSPFWSALGRAREEYRWKREVVLELVDERGLARWSVPNVNPLNDLLAVVQYQFANVNKFLAEILQAEELQTMP